jgi:hypothetical protein
MRKLLVAAACATLPATLLLGPAASAAGGPTALATGLANPRQITFGPDGALYVAVAGSGAYRAAHAGHCSTSPEIGTVCPGDTGGVVRVPSPGTAAAGSGRRVLAGLLSIADKGGHGAPAGGQAVGLDSVTFASDGTEYGIFTYVPPAALSGLPEWVRNEDGKLVSIRGGVVRVVADIGHYGITHPNPGHAPDSDPYGVLAAYGRIYVVDAANNTLLAVENGRIRTLRVFPYRHGNGSDGSFDTVPTSIATDGKGHLYVGTLGSFAPGAARVYVLDRRGRLLRVIRHLDQVTGVAVGPGGTVYVSEIFGGQQGPFDKAGRPTGRIVSIRPDGTRFNRYAPHPGGVAVRGGHLYVSVFSVSPTLGKVIRL